MKIDVVKYTNVTIGPFVLSTVGVGFSVQL